MSLEETQSLDTWLEKSLLSENTDIVLEYRGNELKNTQFVNALEDIDGLMKLLREDNDQVISNCNKFMSSYKSIKSQKDFGKLMGLMDDLIGKYNNDSKKRFEGANGKDKWAEIKKTAKKFSTKYSEMGMTTRENFEKKFKEYLEVAQKMCDDLVKKADELESIYNKIKKIDYDYAGKIYNRVFNSLKYAFESARSTANSLLYLIQILDVDGIKSSMIYNILNKNKSTQLTKAKM